MTVADVNVPELVARAIREPDYIGCSCCAQSEGLDYSRDDPRADGVARLALAALRSPEVVAGIAGVLGEHRPSRWRSFANDVEILRCCGQDFGPHPTRKPKSGDERKAWDRFTEHQARAVVDWLAGGGR